MLAGINPQPIKDVYSSYEAFDQYEPIDLLIDAIPANHVVEAKHKVTGERYFLALRHGEYSAQVDKAVSDIYRRYVPTTPETHIVQQENNFYIASKAVENNVDYQNIPVANACFTPFYFGSNSVLSHFVGASDIHLGNLLISTEDNSNFYSHSIDNAESLNDENLQSAQLKSQDESSAEDSNSCEVEFPEFRVDELDLLDFEPKSQPEAFSVDDIFANHWKLPPVIVNHYQFKKEQTATLSAIANTPFSEFAQILRSNVTASHRVEVLSFMEKLLQHNMIASKSVRNQIVEKLQKQESFPKLSEIEDTIALLEKRHQRYVTLKPI